MKKPTRGVVYIATDQPYLDESEASAESVRANHPEIPITLFTSDELEPSEIFDSMRWVSDPSHDFSDSNLTPEHTPYDQTLFLDSDTHVCGSLDPVFELLEDYDLAATQDPTRTGSVTHEHEHDVPETFPQYNTGVLAYRDSTAVREFFARWSELYHGLDGVKHGLNQPSFRVALYESEINLATLPPEWNFRIGNVANSVLYACGEVKILHGRSVHWTLSDIADQINATDERRVVIAKPYPEIITDDERTVGETAAYTLDRAHWAYRKNGLLSMLLTVGSMVRDKLVKA